MSNLKEKGLVLKNFETKTYAELEKDYAELIEQYKNKKYGVQLSAAQIEFIGTEVLENAKWKGTEVFGIEALRDIVVKLEAGKVVLCDRENVRALFHYLNQFQSEGTEFLKIFKETIEAVSFVVKEINETEIDLRDASFEMEAKKQGITPEQLAKQASGGAESIQ